MYKHFWNGFNHNQALNQISKTFFYLCYVHSFAMKNIFLTTITVVLMTGSSYAQSKTDSLWAVYENKQLTDSHRICALTDFYFEIYKTDVDSALTIARMRYDFAKTFGDTSEMMFAKSNEGFVLGEQRKYKEAVAIYLEALKVQKTRKKWKAVANMSNNLGYMYLRLGETEKATNAYLQGKKAAETAKDTGILYAVYNQLALIADEGGEKEQALKYYFTAIKIAEKQGNKYAQSVFLMNASAIFTLLGNSKRHMDLLNQSMKLKQEIGDVEGLVQIRLNLASEYQTNQEFDKVREQLRLMEATCASHGCSERVRAGILVTRASLASDLQDLDSAAYYFRAAMNMYESISDFHYMVRMAANLGSTLIDLNRYPEAIRVAKKGLEVAERIQHDHGVMRSCEVLYTAYEHTGNKAAAYDHYRRFIKVRDTLNSLDELRNAERLALDFEYEKKQVADSLATAKEKAEQQLAFDRRIERQRWFSYGGGAIAMLMLIVAFISLRSYRQKKRAAAELEEKNQEISYQKLLVEQKQEEIVDSINYALRIQTAILPPPEQLNEHLIDGFVLYIPKDIVAGDFYWLEHVDEWVFFAAADCTGHGVPGAMVSVVCNGALNQAVREYGKREPGEILNVARELVIEQFSVSGEDVKDGMDISLAAINKNTGQLKWAGANNPLWLVRPDGDVVEEIKGDKQPVGQADDQQPFTTHNVTVSAGDTIYLFSDGFADQFGGDRGKKYKSRRFKDYLLTIQNQPMDAQKESLSKEIHSWMGELDQLDDICVIGVKVVESYT